MRSIFGWSYLFYFCPLLSLPLGRGILTWSPNLLACSGLRTERSCPYPVLLGLKNPCSLFCRGSYTPVSTPPSSTRRHFSTARSRRHTGCRLRNVSKKSPGTLERWVAGTLQEKAFQKIYDQNWGHPWPLYRDIFWYARKEKIPMIGSQRALPHHPAGIARGLCLPFKGTDRCAAGSRRSGGCCIYGIHQAFFWNARPRREAVCLFLRSPDRMGCLHRFRCPLPPFSLITRTTPLWYSPETATLGGTASRNRLPGRPRFSYQDRSPGSTGANRMPNTVTLQRRRLPVAQRLASLF